MSFLQILTVIIAIVMPIILGYVAYQNGRIRKLEGAVQKLEVNTALNTRDGRAFEKYLDEFKADIKAEIQSLKELLSKDG